MASNPTILPDSTGAVDPIQIIDQKMTPSQIQQEAPYEDIVWGAFQPSYWQQYHPGMIVSRYYMPFNDDSVASGHDLAWWQANHPDWILYACDQNNIPTHYVARADGFPDVPLDIHNPQVIQYQMQNETPYLLANQYNALAADNITFKNYTGGPNVLVQQNTPPGDIYGSDGWYGCGIWEGSKFVKRYTTGYNKPDPNITADLVTWVKTVRTALNAKNLHFIVNHPIGSPSDPNEQAVVANVDAMAYEASFTGFDRWGANFPKIIQYMQFVQQHHVAYMDIDYFCENNGSPCKTTMTIPEKEFAIGSYELGNEGGAGLFMSPTDGEHYSYYPEFQTKLGSPCGEYTTVATNTYARRFSGGYVVVNNDYPNGSAHSVSLPAHTYADMEKRAVSNPLTVNPRDGYVLTTSANGCQ